MSDVSSGSGRGSSPGEPELGRIAALVESLILACERRDREEVHRLFGALFESWVTHHRNQEAAMRTHAYPRLAGHHLAHMVIRYQLSVCAFKLAELPSTAAPDAVLAQRIRHLRQLQRNHEREFDGPLARYLNSQPAGPDAPG